LARRLLGFFAVQFTIEARPLTSDTWLTGAGAQPRRTTIEAADPQGAISEFVRQGQCQLLSFTCPARGRESIATVKKQDSMYLVRVYADLR
jgi:hypothetical protein